MDPHPLANLFKRSNYYEPIASEFCALDYLYEGLLEIREAENYDEDAWFEVRSLLDDNLYLLLCSISSLYDTICHFWLVDR